MILTRENQGTQRSTFHTVTWSTTSPKCTGLGLMLALCCEWPAQPSTTLKKKSVKLHRINVQVNK